VHRNDVDGRVLPYTKTREQWHVRLLAPLTQDLADWGAASGRGTGVMFPRYDGDAFREVDYRNWRRWRFEPAARAAGLRDSRPMTSGRPGSA